MVPLSSKAARTVRVVRIAGPRAAATCLPQAIVLAEVLHAQGYDAGLRIGVAAAQGPVSASASAPATGIRVVRGRGQAAGLEPSAGPGPPLGPVQAHAWVEIDGRPVGEDPGEYSAFDGAELERVVRRLLSS